MAKFNEIKEYWDPSRELDEEGLAEWSARDACSAKREMVVSDYKACAWALQIPRRLGGDATGAQLAADKKFMRKVMHLQRTLFDKWDALCGESLPVDWAAVGPDERKAGAQIDAGEWLLDHLFVAKRQRDLFCTVAVQVGMVDWGYSCLTIVKLEIANLERIASWYAEDPAHR